MIKGSSFFVGEHVSEGEEIKICRRCKFKGIKTRDFYTTNGRFRNECKACTVKTNVKYQKKKKVWLHRFVDGDENKSYMVDYYSKNKEKFAEYRRQFKERYPQYYKEYAWKRKNEK